MEIAEYKVFADKCFRDTPPPCAAVCPLAYDIREFIKLMQRGSWRSAYRVYRNSVIFPSIVSRICPETCVSACVRGKRPGDKSIDLKALERACTDRMAGKKPERFSIPKKEKSVAVIGAGLSGLACAYRLASFGYPVTVYEQSSLLGGDTGELDPQWCHEELLREFSAVDCTFLTSRPVVSLEEIKADAFYIATGKDSCFSELASSMAAGTAEPRPDVFFGGALRGAEGLEAMAQGLSAVTAIEVYFKIGKTKPVPDVPVRRADERYYDIHYDYSVKEASSGKGEPEAYRCMRCNCQECYEVCPLMEKDKLFPSRICTEITLTLKPHMSKRTGVRIVMGCTDCKKCRDACPEHIDMGEGLSTARTDFYESGAMSPAFHDFWLDDMDFSLSEEASLVLQKDEGRNSDVVFFPGCQLGASSPAYVEKAYEAVCSGSQNPALILGCCGVPAKWAGQAERAAEIAEKLKNTWEELGRPLVLTACPTCLKNLKEILPEAETVSLYSWLLLHPECLPSAPGDPEMAVLSEAEAPGSGAQAAAGGTDAPDSRTVYVLDPCSSVYEEKMPSAVRALLERAGCTVRNPEPDVGCCGFGGHIYNSVPELYHRFAKRRLDGREGVLVSYCANCRDVFAAEGADARHALGLILGIREEKREAPELDERRENRKALRRFYTGEPEPDKPEETPEILITREIVDKMNQEMVLREQVKETIREAERSRMKILDEEDGVYYAHKRFRTVTLWAAYRTEGSRIFVDNIYVHRMEIGEGL